MTTTSTPTATPSVTSVSMSLTYSRPAAGWPQVVITGTPVDVDLVFVTVTANDRLDTDVQAVAISGTARGQSVTWNTELHNLAEFIDALTVHAQDTARAAMKDVSL